MPDEFYNYSEFKDLDLKFEYHFSRKIALRKLALLVQLVTTGNLPSIV